MSRLTKTFAGGAGGASAKDRSLISLFEGWKDGERVNGERG